MFRFIQIYLSPFIPKYETGHKEAYQRLGHRIRVVEKETKGHRLDERHNHRVDNHNHQHVNECIYQILIQCDINFLFDWSSLSNYYILKIRAYCSLSHTAKFM